MKKQTLSERIIAQIGKNIAHTDGTPYISQRNGRFYLRARLNIVGEGGKPKVLNYGLWENKSFETEDDLLFALINTDTWARPLNQKAELAMLKAYHKDTFKRPPLPQGVEEVKMYVMEYGTFDELVIKYLPSPITRFESGAFYEWPNDAHHTYSISNEKPLSDWNVKDLQEWLSGEARRPPSPHVLLRALADRKLIPYGEYLIKVSW